METFIVYILKYSFVFQFYFCLANPEKIQKSNRPARLLVVGPEVALLRRYLRLRLSQRNLFKIMDCVVVEHFQKKYDIS